MSRSPNPAACLVAAIMALVFPRQIHAAPKHAPSPHKATKPTPAHAKHRTSRPTHPPKHRSDATFPADVEGTPGYRYAQLDSESCYAEVAKRRLPLRREAQSWPGITAPMRFSGPINGVLIHTDRLESERATSPYELFDCRLALAMDDFSKLLFAEGVSEVVIFSAYRPPPKSIRADTEQLKRHAGGLAVDIHRMRRADGSWVKIDSDFHGRIGAKTCGAAAAPPSPSTPEAKLLRRVVCAAAEQHLFQLVLTPNYDRAHRNHFHLGLAVGVKWFIAS